MTVYAATYRKPHARAQSAHRAKEPVRTEQRARYDRLSIIERLRRSAKLTGRGTMPAWAEMALAFVTVLAFVACTYGIFWLALVLGRALGTI